MAEPMGIYGFIRLSMNERADVTWERGTFLMSRAASDGVTFNLYAVEDFYVEVAYCHEYNTIVDVSPFASLHLLDPYLQQIDLSRLLG